MSKKVTARCSSVLASSDDRCRNRTLPRSRYCWHHYPKLPLLLAVITSLITGIVLFPIQDTWRKIFPSDESRGIDSLQDQLDLRNQRLTTATIIVNLTVHSDAVPNTSYRLAHAQMDWFITINGRRDNFLVAVTNEYAVLPNSMDQREYRAQFQLHKNCSAYGKPVAQLANTEEISIAGWIPDGFKVLGGKVTVLVNGQDGPELPVAPQDVKGGTVWIRDVAPLRLWLTG